MDALTSNRYLRIFQSFVRGKITLVEAGIEALLNLITHARSCPQVDLFDHTCKRGQNKRVFLYQQHRFIKLGKTALSMLDDKDVLLVLLDEIDATNQLAEACKLYISSEPFITELECLDFFNHFVTFPYLNSVERCTQTE